MKKALVGLVAIAALVATPALAADMTVKAPATPASDWTGFYAGVNGGWAWDVTGWQYSGALVGSGAGYTVPFTATPAGGIVGGTVGYNWQINPSWVIGVEADWDWTDMWGSEPCPNSVYSCQSKLSDLGSARLRLGYDWVGMLIYATGGAAWGDETVQTVNGATGVTTGTTSTRLGYMAGMGVEAPLFQNISIKVDWLFYDLGSHSYLVDSPAVQNVSSREFGNTLRMGFNWHFFTGPR